MRALQAKNQDLQKENIITEEQTRELKRKQERFSADPAFVERTARESGMAKPNETIFKFTNKQTEETTEPLKQ